MALLSGIIWDFSIKGNTKSLRLSSKTKSIFCSDLQKFAKLLLRIRSLFCFVFVSICFVFFFLYCGYWTLLHTSNSNEQISFIFLCLISYSLSLSYLCLNGKGWKTITLSFFNDSPVRTRFFRWRITFIFVVDALLFFFSLLKWRKRSVVDNATCDAFLHTKFL